jgi:hypothetical protein
MTKASSDLRQSVWAGSHGCECEDDSILWGLVEVDIRFRGAYCLHRQTNLWNVGLLPRHCAAPYIRRLSSTRDVFVTQFSRSCISKMPLFTTFDVMNEKIWIDTKLFWPLLCDVTCQNIVLCYLSTVVLSICGFQTVVCILSVVMEMFKYKNFKRMFSMGLIDVVFCSR